MFSAGDPGDCDCEGGGSSGATGLPGPPGLNGSPGATGRKGEQGDTGSSGFSGPSGSDVSQVSFQRMVLTALEFVCFEKKKSVHLCRGGLVAGASSV